MWKTPGVSSHVSSSWIYPVLNAQRLDALKLRVPVRLGAIILLAIKNTENEKNNLKCHITYTPNCEWYESAPGICFVQCERDHLLTASSDSPCSVGCTWETTAPF